MKSDVAKLASMQKLGFEFLQNGYVQVQLELFTGNKRGLIDFRLKEKPKKLVCRGETIGILTVCIIRQDGAVVNLLLKESEICARIVNRKFDSLGIRLGYGSKKEREMRELFVTDLLTIAEIVLLPRKHGWHKNTAGEWGFSFPEDLTWEEVLAYA